MRGPGNPPARFFVQFQQSSEEVGPFVPLFIDCVNIAKRRRRSGGPSPAPRPLPGEKSPSTRPKYTARQPPAPGPPARHFPLPQPGLERCQPRHVPSRENQLPGPCTARLVPWQRPPPCCAPQLVAGVAGPDGAHNLGTPLWPPDRGSPDPRLVRSGPERPARSCDSTLLVSRSATALLAESARVWASPWSLRPLPPRAPAPASIGC